MPIPVKLPDDLVSEAKRYAKIQHRSVPMQLEHWARIGKILEDNPDLSYNFVEHILEAMEEKEAGMVYEFGELMK
jgi:hypothetical protein